LTKKTYFTIITFIFYFQAKILEDFILNQSHLIFLGGLQATISKFVAIKSNGQQYSLKNVVAIQKKQSNIAQV